MARGRNEEDMDDVKEAVEIIEEMIEARAGGISEPEEDEDYSTDREKQPPLLFNNKEEVKQALRSLEHAMRHDPPEACEAEAEARSDAARIDSLAGIRTILRLKEALLRVYLLNYIFYTQSRDEDHPVKSALIKLSVYLEMVMKLEGKVRYRIEKIAEGQESGDREHRPAIGRATDNPSEDEVENEPDGIEQEPSDERRPIDYKMAKNRGQFERRRKKEEHNPRIKNKRRFGDAQELGRRVREAGGAVNFETKRNKRF